jgi:HEAT repeat protein
VSLCTNSASAGEQRRNGSPESVFRQLGIREIAELVQDLSHRPDLNDRLLQTLDALVETGDLLKLLPVIAPFVHHPDPQVRSKAVLVIGRASRNMELFERALDDPNDRVRANAVESMWGIPSTYAAALLRRATKDAHNRVAANAAVGLHLIGDRAGAEALEAMANSPDPMFRASATWAFGKLADPCFLSAAQRLRGDPDPKVRHLALRSLACMRQRALTDSTTGTSAAPSE